jgi:hypothetical protein
MANAIVQAEQVTPEWLSAKLQAQGLLTHGKVTRVVPGQAQSTFASSIWRLEVNYSTDASPGAPQRLFLKVSNPALAPGEFDPSRLHQETVFYREIAPAMGQAFTIPCFEAAIEADTGASHILLKDVSETHASCRTPHNLRNCEQAVDCLAHLHAFWWDHPRLGKDVGWYPTHEERQRDWINAEKSTTAFIALLGNQLPLAWRAVYQRVLPALPSLFERHASGRNLTLVHGDAHLGNFLFPKDEAAAPAYLIDWQFWHPTIGGTDLAFMMTPGWEIESRRQLEKDLLERYYQQLITQGVRGYSWDECWNDYRLSIILVSIFIPVWRWSTFHWAPDMTALERGMAAFEDLDCSDLLHR